jgi:peptidoglycan/LPS O-acetylase OafA/YrhL
MLLILAILALSVILLIELPGLIKNRLYREIWVFSLLFLIGAYMAFAQLYQWPLPNPLADLYPLLEN